MKLDDIVLQLLSVFPANSTEASNQVAVSSMSYAGGVVTVDTTAPHEQVTGNTVVVTGISSLVPVTSIERSGTVATVTTTADHDLTEDYSENITISGADQSEYNGVFDPLTVPNRRTFTIMVSGTAPSPATGTILVDDHKERGFNGNKTITVTSPTQFTYLADPGSYTEFDFSSVDVVTSVNIAPSIDIDRFLEMYTQTLDNADKIWLVPVLGDETSNNSRHIETDAADMYSPGTDYRQKVIQELSVFVAIPCRDQLSAEAARDRVEDIKEPLYKSLIGFKPQTYMSIQQQYGLTLLNHGYYGYNKSFYVHEFVFQAVSEIVLTDIVEPDLNVAFRDITLQLQNSLNYDIMTTEIDLDDEPIS